MDPEDGDDRSREALAERVEELEAKQAEQREWWQKALPSRRGVLTAGAGVGLGALLTGSASGQSAAGQVGTDSERVDVFANELNGADVSTTAGGQVPTSQGDGTLAMEEVGGGGLWKEDANSPLTISGSTSGTITLSQTYNRVLLIISSAASSNFDPVDLQVNGDTGNNYEYRNDDGSNTTSADGWELTPLSMKAISSIPTIVLTGEWSYACTGSVDGPGITTVAEQLQNNNVSSPLDSITLTSASTFDATVHVFGWSP